MKKILIIDDEVIFHKMIAHALKDQDFLIESSYDGLEAQEKAKQFCPDVIVTDVMMPEMDGYEVTRQFRRQPEFAHTPILVLTTQSDLEDKLKAFEAGADDHMAKPFAPAELLARLNVLLRRSVSVRDMQQEIKAQARRSKIIAVHSLRGGSGCSSLAVNLALGLNNIWNRPVILVDAVMNAGQIALMLSGSLKRTWADVADYDPDDLDIHALKTIIHEHKSGLHFIAAPTLPVEGENLTDDLLDATVNLLEPQYEYLLFDLAHDFGKLSLKALDMADTILLVTQPELASLRSASAALQTYADLGYEERKVKLVLNHTFEHRGITRNQIEKALHRSVNLTVPFAPNEFITAINHGRPLMDSSPNHRVSNRLADYAYRISKVSHKKLKNPGNVTWERIQKRLGK